jgi:hypothetical protein
MLGPDDPLRRPGTGFRLTQVAIATMVTNCPSAVPTEERMLNTAGRSVAVNTGYRDVTALR